MKVFILRHGEAGTAATDRERELTPKGFEQALQAGLLLEHEGAQTLLYSPKTRTRQTAEQVASLCAQLPCQESLSLLPPATVDDITAVLEELEEAGTSAVSSGNTHRPRNFQSATMSITQRIGSKIAAAWTGEITSAIKGTAATPRPPPNPPLEIAYSKTAGIATA